MKRILIISFTTVILSASLLFANNNESYIKGPYTYFIHNEDSLTKEQLSQIVKLKNEYQNKIYELREKIHLEKVKMNLEMSKKNPNAKVVNKSMNLNIKYAKELKKITNEFLQKYKQIKEKK